MSMPPEPSEPRQKGLKGTLKHKIGPLPTWAWVAIVAGVIVAWAYWKNRQAGTTPTPATTGSGQVPQFVNQTYTTVSPPPAPDQDQDEDKTPDKDVDHDQDVDRKHPKPPGRREGPPYGKTGGPPTVQHKRHRRRQMKPA